jgi:phage gp29-like protein
VQWWAIYLEKYGMPTVKGTVPTGTPQAQRTELLNALKSIQQETALVHTIDQTVEFLTATLPATGTGGFESAIAYCDKQIVKGLICQTLTTDEGERVGSMALGKVHESILDILLKKLRRKLEEMVDEQIIRPLIDYNFAQRFYPNFALSIDEKDVSGLSEAIFRLVSCEAVDPRESWIREYLGLPAREELEPEPIPEQVIPTGLPIPQKTEPTESPQPQATSTGGA